MPISLSFAWVVSTSWERSRTCLWRSSAHYCSLISSINGTVLNSICSFGSEFSFFSHFNTLITVSICFNSCCKSLFLLSNSTRFADMFFRSFMKPSTSLKLALAVSNSPSNQWFSLLTKSSWSLSFWTVSLLDFVTYSTFSWGSVWPPSYKLLNL